MAMSAPTEEMTQPDRDLLMTSFVTTAGKRSAESLARRLEAVRERDELRRRHDRTLRGRIAKWLLGPHYPEAFDPTKLSDPHSSPPR